MKASQYIVCLLLIVVFGLTVCYILRKSKFQDLENAQKELIEKNEDLAKEVAEQDSLLKANERITIILTDSILIQKRITANLKKDYENLKKQYKEVIDGLAEISADSSYQFLTEIAYPYEGEKKYPFNEPQVKEIHVTYIEREQLHFLNASLISQVWSQDLEISMQEARYGQARRSIDIMVASRKNLDTVIQNQDRIIELQIQETKREKRKKILWQVGTGVAFLVGLII